MKNIKVVVVMLFMNVMIIAIAKEITKAENIEINAEDYEVGTIVNYSKWVKANTQKQLVRKPVFFLGDAMDWSGNVAIGDGKKFTKGQTDRNQNSPEHISEENEKLEVGKEIYSNVYVNETAKTAIMIKNKPKFPEGSIIVRTKETSNSLPDLLTVMIKRKKGFNPSGGDWEYLVMNGLGTEIKNRQKTGQCQTCHSLSKKQGYVFRTYLNLSR